jgi:phosphatidate cytidylyltransferase
MDMARGPAAWRADLVPRAVSAVVMVAGVLVALALGPIAFEALVLLGAAILAWEWTRLCGAGRFGASGAIVAVSVLVAVILAGFDRMVSALAIVLAGALVVYGVAALAGRAHPRWIAAGPLYIGLPAIALIWLRGHDEAGHELIVWLLVTVWATDIGAYFAGRLAGGPRLAPRVSPNKTWAGLGGAVASAALIGLIAAGVDSAAPAAVPLAAAGAILAVVAQMGDLGESWVKRRFGVKDTGHLIPGHGGLFDRVDGLLAAAAVLALWQFVSDGGLSWH